MRGTVGPAYDTLYPPARNPWSLAHITGGFVLRQCRGRCRRPAAHHYRLPTPAARVRGPAVLLRHRRLQADLRARADIGTLAACRPAWTMIGPMSANDRRSRADPRRHRRARSSDASTVALSRPGAIRRAPHRLRPQLVRAGPAAGHPAVVAAMDEAVSTLLEPSAPSSSRSICRTITSIEVAGRRRAALRGLRRPRRRTRRTAREGFGRKTFHEASPLARAHHRRRISRRPDAPALHFSNALDREVFARFDALVTVDTLTPALAVSMFGDRLGVDADAHHRLQHFRSSRARSAGRVSTTVCRSACRSSGRITAKRASARSAMRSSAPRIISAQRPPHPPR